MEVQGDHCASLIMIFFRKIECIYMNIYIKDVPVLSNYETECE
jgi:hypothetical protein